MHKHNCRVEIGLTMQGQVNTFHLYHHHHISTTSTSTRGTSTSSSSSSTTTIATTTTRCSSNSSNNNNDNNNDGLNLNPFNAPQAFTFKPLFICTTGGKLHVPPQLPRGKMTEAILRSAPDINAKHCG